MNHRSFLYESRPVNRPFLQPPQTDPTEPKHMLPIHYPPVSEKKESTESEQECLEKGTGWKIPIDNRSAADFKQFTFTGYSRSAAASDLYKQLNHGDYENAFYWSAELLCAGHWEDIWEVVAHYAAVNINVENILIHGYIWSRLKTAGQLAAAEAGAFEFRNNDSFRVLIAEMLTVVIMAKKSPPIPVIKIKRAEDLQMGAISSKLEAFQEYTGDIFRRTDSIEYKVPMNELVHHLIHSRNNILHACYWIEWILEFELLCRTNKCPLFVDARNKYNVPANTANDAVWLIWEVLWHVLFMESCELDGISNQLSSFPEESTKHAIVTAKEDSLQLPDPDLFPMESTTAVGNNMPVNLVHPNEKRKKLHICQKTLAQKKMAIQYLQNLFCYRYSRTISKKRRPLLHCAVAILSAESFVTEDLMKTPSMWNMLQSQLYKIYDALHDQAHS